MRGFFKPLIPLNGCKGTKKWANNKTNLHLFCFSNESTFDTLLKGTPFSLFLSDDFLVFTRRIQYTLSLSKSLVIFQRGLYPA